MKLRILAVLAALALGGSAFAATEGSDNAGTGYSGGWTNGSGAGVTGFSAWTINAIAGTGSAGTFIGDPSSGGISGMSATSFGLYANAIGSGASVTATRSFVGGLTVGQTFSLQWGINWDGDNGINGNKGFNILFGGTELVNINNGGNSDITVNGTNTGFGFGTSAMTWSFTLTSPTLLNVQANDRDGTGSYNVNIDVSAGAPDGFQLYASELNTGDNRQPYFNNFEIVPEPSTMVMALVGALGLVAARRRLQK